LYLSTIAGCHGIGGETDPPNEWVLSDLLISLYLGC